MLDLDDFKGVNDALGHQAGDRLLAEISRALVAAGRDTDRVFRYGGDEFALILPGADAAVGARRRRAGPRRRPGARRDGLRAGPTRTSRSASRSALATFPRDGTTAEEILLAADRACFVAKRTGNGLIATADEGLAIARDFSFKSPTPIDVVEPVRTDPSPPRRRSLPPEARARPRGPRRRATASPVGTDHAVPPTR